MTREDVKLSTNLLRILSFILFRFSPVGGYDSAGEDGGGVVGGTDKTYASTEFSSKSGSPIHSARGKE